MPLCPRGTEIVDEPFPEDGDTWDDAAAWLDTCHEAVFARVAFKPGRGEADIHESWRYSRVYYPPSSSPCSTAEHGEIHTDINTNSNCCCCRDRSSNYYTTYTAATARPDDGRTGGLRVEDNPIGKCIDDEKNSSSKLATGVEVEEESREESDDHNSDSNSDDSFSHDFSYGLSHTSTDENHTSQTSSDDEYHDGNDDGGGDDDWQWSGSDEVADDWETPEDWYRWGGLSEQSSSLYGHHNHQTDTAELGRKAWAY